MDTKPTQLLVRQPSKSASGFEVGVAKTGLERMRDALLLGRRGRRLQELANGRRAPSR